MNIPKTFDNFKQKEIATGVETTSETLYKGYVIFLRSRTTSGMSGRIIKKNEAGKKIVLCQKSYAFILPINFLRELKAYIDSHATILTNKFNLKSIKR